MARRPSERRGRSRRVRHVPKRQARRKRPRRTGAGLRRKPRGGRREARQEFLVLFTQRYRKNRPAVETYQFETIVRSGTPRGAIPVAERKIGSAVGGRAESKIWEAFTWLIGVASEFEKLSDEVVFRKMVGDPPRLKASYSIG